MRAILGFHRRRARDAGVQDGRCGAVAILQRLGGALNRNVHIHALVVDGVFAKHGDSVRFHPFSSHEAADVDEVLATAEAYVQRLVAGRGVEAGNDGGDALDEWTDDAPVLAELAALTPRQRIHLILYHGVLAPRAAWRSLVSSAGP